MRNELTHEKLHQALEAATSGLQENPFLYERVKARITEGEPAMKKKISWSLVLALALTVITLTALAAGLLFGQEWYQAYRDGLVNADPEKYAAITSHLTSPAAQTATEHSLVSMTVQDVAWVPEKKVLTVSVRATLKEPAQYELYPMDALDADGAYVGSDMPSEGSEERTEHWLWKSSADSNETVRHGPPAVIMDAPAKTLLLIDADALSGDDAMTLKSRDAVRLSDGSCLFYYEYSLDWLDEQSNAKAAAKEQLSPDMQTFYDQQLRQAEASRAVLLKGKGLTYTVSYRVIPFTESITDEELYLGGEKGSVTFTVVPQ